MKIQGHNLDQTTFLLSVSIGRYIFVMQKIFLLPIFTQEGMYLWNISILSLQHHFLDAMCACVCDKHRVAMSTKVIRQPTRA